MLMKQAFYASTSYCLKCPAGLSFCQMQVQSAIPSFVQSEMRVKIKSPDDE
ncbi:MAG: hypothetical protein K2Q22_16615 [Cytophagales bacterium]|nr:hypothetical protein [Cytophagales bacterium]